jgi:hypothetical protein
VTDQSPVGAQMDLIANCGADSTNRFATIEDGNPTAIEWVLDSGCGRHLTGSPELLGWDAKSASTPLYLPDGSIVHSTRVGDVALKMETEESENNVVVKNVELVSGFQRNLLSYVRLEEKGIRLLYVGNKRYLANKDNEELTEVHQSGNLLVVRALVSSAYSNAESICNAIAEHDHGEAHADNLFNFHVQLGHLNYSAIEDLAAKPESGIKLTDRLKPNCIACAEEKQTRSVQSQKDSGSNSPIDRIGGVICSDLKGPVTPNDRLGNRYLVNFIDDKTNYCRVFLAKTKDEATKKLNIFLRFLSDASTAKFRSCEQMVALNIRMLICSASKLEWLVS